jgi:hypothetical protein
MARKCRINGFVLLMNKDLWLFSSSLRSVRAAVSLVSCTQKLALQVYHYFCIMSCDRFSGVKAEPMLHLDARLIERLACSEVSEIRFS